METSFATPSEDCSNNSHSVMLSPAASSDSAMRAVKLVKSDGVAMTGKTTGSLSSAGKKTQENGAMGSTQPKPTLMKPTLGSNASALPRRNSIGGLSEKRAVMGSTRPSIDGKKVSPSVLNSAKRSSK